MSVRRATVVLAVSCLLVGSPGISSTARAASLSQSATPPATNVLVSQLNFHPDYKNDAVKDGNRDFTDNSGPVGQTFTVPSAAQLQAVTVHGNGDLGGLQDSPGLNFHIRIGSVDPGTRAITPLRDEVAPEAAVAGDDDYLTFTLTNPVSVAPGTLYSFSIYSEGGWYGLAHSNGDVYAAGGPFNSNTSTRNNGDNTDGLGKNAGFGTFAAVNPNPYDFVFSLQGTVPEPASLATVGLALLPLLVRRRPRH